MSPEARERAFDALATEMASGSISRGKALRLMGAALIGGALGSLGIRGASADLCKRNEKVCKKNSQCCSGNCVKSSGSATGICTAACPSGQVMCGGSCVPNSCLTIGHVFNTSTCQCECPPDRVTLQNGLCAKPCTSNADCPPGCSGGCVPEFSGAQYCATTEPRVEGGCNSEGPCPEESFCVRGGTECRVAC